VSFEAPSDRDFEQFKEALDLTPRAQIHAHCIYNARVSAFFYRYAMVQPGMSTVAAIAMMESVWRPGNDWAGFLGLPAAGGQPNRYAGNDYETVWPVSE